MFGLHPEQARQIGNDAKTAHLEQAGHDRRDVPGVAHRDKQDLARQIPVEPLGDFIGIGFLPKDAPAVLRIEQGHAIVLGQMLDDLHAVVEYAGHLKHGRTGAEGLGKLLRRHLALRQQHGGLDGMPHIRAVQSRGSRRIPGRGADGQHLIPSVLAYKRTQIAVRAGHAAILKGSARVLAVVLERERGVQLLLEFGSAVHDRGVPFAEVQDVFLLQHGGHQLIKPEHAAQGRVPGGGPAVEQVAPICAAVFLQFVEGRVFKQKYATAARTRIQQFINGVTGPTAEAHVFHLRPVGRKLIGHGRSVLRYASGGKGLPPLAPVFGESLCVRSL